ncbi:hypothetical protein D3C80_1777330 [compost metagenome]
MRRTEVLERRIKATVMKVGIPHHWAAGRSQVANLVLLKKVTIFESLPFSHCLDTDLLAFVQIHQLPFIRSMTELDLVDS